MYRGRRAYTLTTVAVSVEDSTTTYAAITLLHISTFAFVAVLLLAVSWYLLHRTGRFGSYKLRNRCVRLLGTIAVLSGSLERGG